MQGIRLTRLKQHISMVFLGISCTFAFVLADAEAKNWFRYHSDETSSYYYDKDSVAYPYKKKRVFGWVTDKDIVGLWVKIIEQDKEPPSEDTEMFQPEENAAYVEVTCSKKEANLKDNVPYDAQKDRMTFRITIPDEKLVRGIEASAAKEALIDVICRPY